MWYEEQWRKVTGPINYFMPYLRSSSYFLNESFESFQCSRGVYPAIGGII